ncbi:DUF6297 family protein [Saccharothrix luteola]|uniref:DUF6297 family protein n=1 Tax=Saccharothrix luteola TaxID=2893018 RepID=UPI001E5C0494|nr:DUF6297 family protein [Saccharothrix luteola]MCC8250518.1 DUF6297 family protein [Saccharothrix luteola]
MAARIPSVGEVRKRQKSSSESHPGWRVKLVTWYERLIYVAVFGGIAYELASSGLNSAPREGTAWTASTSEWSYSWLSLLVALILAKTVLAFGPIFAGREQTFWILSSPVDRAALLLRRFLVLAALGLLLGAVWPAVVLGVVKYAHEPAVAQFVVSAAFGLSIVSGAVVLQRTRVRAHRVQLWLSGAIAVAVLAQLYGLTAQPAVPSLLAPDAVLAVLLLVAAAVTFAAVRALHHIRRASLSAGAALASVVAVSVSWFELSLLGSIMVERRALLLGRVRSARLRGSGFAVLVWVDLLRILRGRNALLVWAALIPVPMVMALSAAVDFVPAFHLVAAFLATDRLAGGLRFVCRSPAMRRMLGVPVRYLRTVHLVVPGAGAVLWCAVTVPLTPGLTLANGVVSALGAVAVTYRIATRPPLDYAAAAIDFGLFGPTPIGLIVQLSRGPALLLVLAGVQMALI